MAGPSRSEAADIPTSSGGRVLGLRYVRGRYMPNYSRWKPGITVGAGGACRVLLRRGTRAVLPGKKIDVVLWCCGVMVLTERIASSPFRESSPLPLPSPLSTPPTPAGQLVHAVRSRFGLDVVGGAKAGPRRQRRRESRRHVPSCPEREREREGSSLSSRGGSNPAPLPACAATKGGARSGQSICGRMQHIDALTFHVGLCLFRAYP